MVATRRFRQPWNALDARTFDGVDGMALVSIKGRAESEKDKKIVAVTLGTLTFMHMARAARILSTTRAT